ncbi:MAG: adenylate/guanylate cyclase domain-containing protein [Chlamydiota bacterium]|jgi:adenylate cyclase
MKYRTKLYISFAGLIVISTLIGVGLIYFETREFLFNELKSKVLSISATASALINGDSIKEIVESKDILSPSFKTTQKQLIKTRNVNRRPDIYVQYLYTVHRDPNDAFNILIGVDADEDPKTFLPPGKVYEEGVEIKIADHIEEYYVPENFVEERWGKFLSAYTPILDKQGNFIASMVVNVRATDVLQKLHFLIFLGVIAIGIAFLLSLTVAFFLSNLMTRSLAALCRDVNIIGKGDLGHKCHIPGEDEFSELGFAIDQMTDGLKEREKIKTNFAKYVSHQVLEKVLESKEEVKLEGERKEVTILFSDIPRFSKIAEDLSPEEVVSCLNEYFEIMIDIILDNNGTIDKFIGEGIMVEYGAPVDDPKQEEKAVLSAIAMHEALKKLKEKWRSENKPDIDMCIGIHTGPAIVGNIGAEERMEYTAIGDTVNISARLIEQCKVKNKKIIVSKQTYQKVGFPLNAEKLGVTILPGKEIETEIYAIEP